MQAGSVYFRFFCHGHFQLLTVHVVLLESGKFRKGRTKMQLIPHQNPKLARMGKFT